MRVWTVEFMGSNSHTYFQIEMNLLLNIMGLIDYFLCIFYGALVATQGVCCRSRSQHLWRRPHSFSDRDPIYSDGKKVISYREIIVQFKAAKNIYRANESSVIPVLLCNILKLGERNWSIHNSGKMGVIIEIFLCQFDGLRLIKRSKDRHKNKILSASSISLLNANFKGCFRCILRKLSSK